MLQHNFTSWHEELQGYFSVTNWCYDQNLGQRSKLFTFPYLSPCFCCISYHSPWLPCQSQQQFSLTQGVKRALPHCCTMLLIILQKFLPAILQFSDLASSFASPILSVACSALRLCLCCIAKHFPTNHHQPLWAPGFGYCHPICWASDFCWIYPSVGVFASAACSPICWTLGFGHF